MGAELARHLAIWGVRSYQVLLSPLLGGACRFSPSCSCYAAAAIERYGARRGGWLALKRIARCHPFGSHGWDPVPELGPEMSGTGPSAVAAGQAASSAVSPSSIAGR
jgi:putative membrane protein insertion efficiency factor